MQREECSTERYSISFNLRTVRSLLVSGRKTWDSIPLTKIALLWRATCLLRPEQVLAGIFGKKAASSIVSGAGKAKRRGGALDGAARKKALAASRKVEVTEFAKYAGKDIV